MANPSHWLRFGAILPCPSSLGAFLKFEHSNDEQCFLGPPMCLLAAGAIMEQPKQLQPMVVLIGGIGAFIADIFEFLV
jgi:hypothetical protein